MDRDRGQFVPTIGTYISITLPVLVGLLSPQPVIGVIALVWAIAYQQMENLLIEPRVNSKAVDVIPAVAFGAVLLGAALFGVAGAFLAVPVVAILLALLQVYGHATSCSPTSRRPLTQPIRSGQEVEHGASATPVPTGLPRRQGEHSDQPDSALNVGLAQSDHLKDWPSRQRGS